MGGGLISSSTQYDPDSNNFNGQMLFLVEFYEKLGISDCMSTGNSSDDHHPCIGVVYHHTPSLLIQSKGGSRLSWFMRLTATAGSDVVQSGRPIFDDFFQHLWPYIGNNTANVVFEMVKRLWLIRID
ncbi:hypothetical protein TNCV_888231 [Trichonephila clavipes]|nr:hypothetical protein TNCV_888231 [Trichonephila clavipes]